MGFSVRALDSWQRTEEKGFSRVLFIWGAQTSQAALPQSPCSLNRDRDILFKHKRLWGILLLRAIVQVSTVVLAEIRFLSGWFMRLQDCSQGRLYVVHGIPSYSLLHLSRKVVRSEPTDLFPLDCGASCSVTSISRRLSRVAGR